MDFVRLSALENRITEAIFSPPNGAIRWMHQYVYKRLNTSAYVCLLPLSDDVPRQPTPDHLWIRCTFTLE